MQQRQAFPSLRPPDPSPYEMGIYQQTSFQVTPAMSNGRRSLSSDHGAGGRWTLGFSTLGPWCRSWPAAERGNESLGNHSADSARGSKAGACPTSSEPLTSHPRQHGTAFHERHINQNSAGQLWAAHSPTKTHWAASI